MRLKQDEFPAKVIRVLAERVANRCSKCSALTSGPQVDTSKSINVGVASHITAASRGGKRHDPSLSSKARSHPDNGIWLCQTCSKLVDSDAIRFPARLLRKWKTEAERFTFNHIGQTNRGRTSAEIERPALTLTPEDPTQASRHCEKWLLASASDLQKAVDDRECAWVHRFEGGVSTRDIVLNYRRAPLYDRLLPRLAEEALKSYKDTNPADWQRLIKEPWGQQVRLEKVGFDHSRYKHVLSLSPIKYLYYVAIQARLWQKQLRALRDYAFENALNALKTKETLVLPSHFAIHMAVVSRNGFALLRQRTFFTEL